MTAHAQMSLHHDKSSIKTPNTAFCTTFFYCYLVSTWTFSFICEISKQNQYTITQHLSLGFDKKKKKKKKKKVETVPVSDLMVNQISHWYCGNPDRSAIVSWNSVSTGRKLVLCKWHAPSRKYAYISFDPLKPHYYIVQLGFTGVYAKNHRLWYSLEPPHRGGSNEYLQSMFWAEIWKKKKKHIFFYLKIFLFWL